MLNTVLDRESIPPKILAGMDRLGRILDDDLAELADFDIGAVWHYLPPVGSGKGKIGLELTTRNELGQSRTLLGEYPLELLGETERRIRVAFSDQVLDLTKVLSHWNREELRAQRARLAAYEPLAAD